MTIKEWLNTDPPAEDIAKLKVGEEVFEYLPIGIVERTLDEFDQFDCGWSAENFKFQVFKTGNYWFASGSIELALIHSSGRTIRRSGACTMVINSKDDNMDYEATVLSFCVSNAAKKLGRRFGRHFNGRMEVGETGRVIDRPQPEEEKPDRITDRVKKMIDAATDINGLAKIKEHCQTEELTSYYMKKLKSFPI